MSGCLLAAAASAVFTASPAHAGVSCYGDYCSGQDPDATGCSADAVSTAFLQLDDGRLDLRWSPTCKTNWTRYEQYPYGSFAWEAPLSVSAVQDTGYSQSISWPGSVAEVGTHWTPMIYSPERLVHAQLNMNCGDRGIVASAFDCAMNGVIKTDAA